MVSMEMQSARWENWSDGWACMSLSNIYRERTLLLRLQSSWERVGLAEKWPQRSRLAEELGRARSARAEGQHAYVVAC